MSFLIIASLKFLISSGGKCKFQPWAFGPPVQASYSSCFAPLIFGVTLGFPIIIVGSLIFGIMGRMIESRIAKAQGIKEKQKGKRVLIILSIILVLIIIGLAYSVIRFLSAIGG